MDMDKNGKISAEEVSKAGARVPPNFDNLGIPIKFCTPHQYTLSFRLRRAGIGSGSRRGSA